MKTARALIAEDEPILALTLAKSLERLWPELAICSTVGSGVAAVAESLEHRPDVLFLDIKMPGKTGLDAAQELAEEWPDDRPFPLVVFVTAFDEYALQAFEQAAVDYVTKPISDDRLAKTVARLQARLAQTQDRSGELGRIVGQLRALAPDTLPQSERLTMIRAAVGNQIRLIPIDEVLYFEATDKYVNVVTAEHESLIRTSLRELLPQLDHDRFWQIHRAVVVNTAAMQSAIRDDSGKLSVKLRGCTKTLQVSRMFAHLFKQM